MKSWLPREAKYVKIVIEPQLQAHLGSPGGTPAILAILNHQITDALGGKPTAWRWEQEGDNIVVGAAL